MIKLTANPSNLINYSALYNYLISPLKNYENNCNGKDKPAIGPDGTFSRKVAIKGNTTSATSGGPPNFTSIVPDSAPIKGGINISVPAYGVVYLVADGSL